MMVLRLVILGEVGDRSASIVYEMILLLKRVGVTIRILIIYFGRLKEERAAQARVRTFEIEGP